MTLLVERAPRRAFAVASLIALTVGYACSEPERDFGPEEQLGGAAGELNAAGSTSGGANAVGGTDGSGGKSGTGGSNGSGGSTPSPCGESVCQNGGECIEDGDSFTCDCNGTGYAGDTCDENIDECEDSPCQNGTSCNDTPGSYTCDCAGAPEYTGKDCDLLRFEVLPADFFPQGISTDGRVVVGKDTYRAVKYTAGKVTVLGGYVGDPESIAYASSDGGGVIVGASILDTTRRAVRWSAGSVDLLEMPEGYTWCEATDVTPDGRVIVGYCDDNVVRWVDGALEPLGIAEDVMSCTPNAVSADGTAIAGSCHQQSSSSSFLWREGTGFSILGPLPNASQCLAHDLNEDGSVVVGTCSTTSYVAAYYWSSSEGTQALHNTESGVYTTGYVRGIARDGSLLVGENSSGGTLWEGVAGQIQLLEAVLPPATTEWLIDGASGVSDDGKVILGTAHVDTPSFEERGFIMRLD